MPRRGCSVDFSLSFLIGTPPFGSGASPLVPFVIYRRLPMSRRAELDKMFPSLVERYTDRQGYTDWCSLVEYLQIEEVTTLRNRVWKWRNAESWRLRNRRRIVENSSGPDPARGNEQKVSPDRVVCGDSTRVGTVDLYAETRHSRLASEVPTGYYVRTFRQERRSCPNLLRTGIL